MNFAFWDDINVNFVTLVPRKHNMILYIYIQIQKKMQKREYEIYMDLNWSRGTFLKNYLYQSFVELSINMC